jgi:hypothetical protein
MVLDSVGNLYGTTEGGANKPECSGAFAQIGCGVVFKIDRGSDDQLDETN